MAATDGNKMTADKIINFDVKANVHYIERLFSKILVFDISNMNVVIKTTKNWTSLPVSYFGKSESFRARFKDGKIKTYSNLLEFFNDALIRYMIGTGAEGMMVNLLRSGTMGKMLRWQAGLNYVLA